MSLAYNYLKSPLLSWKSTGKLQQTVSNCIKKTGIGLHSGLISTVTIRPSAPPLGRYFVVGSTFIPANINNAVRKTPLCTVLSKNGYSIRTLEHLLSALEASGVDNCCIEIESGDGDCSFEVPIFDGSAKEWVDAIEKVGVKVAVDGVGKSYEKLAPFVNERVYVQKNDSFIAAFPCSSVKITYGIDYPQVPAIGCQWFTTSLVDECFYSKQIASCRTFCVYEEVEEMRRLGLIKGGSLESAMVCSVDRGWLNPPLRFDDEPCRHKVLDLIGDFSLLAQNGSQGLLVAHVIAYKAGHSLHTEFVRCLLGMNNQKRVDNFCF